MNQMFSSPASYKTTHKAYIIVAGPHSSQFTQTPYPGASFGVKNHII